MIVISPSKTMNLENLTTKPLNLHFSEYTNTIATHLKAATKDELAKILTIKNKTLDTTYAYYQQWPTNTKSALSLYQGVSFSEIKTFNWDYIKDNIYIFSTLYGIVNGQDNISPYRLDFLAKNMGEFNLYKTWKCLITPYLNQLKPNYILDLCSLEFSKLLEKDKLTMPVYQLKINCGHKLSSVFLKQLRGKLVEFSISNNITEINAYTDYHDQDIKNISIDHDNHLLIIDIK